jgi:hypothetical protein
MVENARFFTQKRTFLHIFAGGRDDFLAGQKSAFLGVRVSRERPRPRPEFCFENSPRRVTRPDGQRKQKKNFFFHLH